MNEGILVGKSAREWFREVVSDSISRRRLKIQEVTEFYLVDLLAGHLERGPATAEEPCEEVPARPLALCLLEAMLQDRAGRVRELRRLGDTALYVAGFFGDSLAGRAIGIDYYISMGERAYRALAAGAGEGDLFAELAERFEEFVDLFAEIAELSDLRSARGLVRLYHRFLATRSERVGALLRERGVAVSLGSGPPPRGLRH